MAKNTLNAGPSYVEQPGVAVQDAHQVVWDLDPEVTEPLTGTYEEAKVVEQDTKAEDAKPGEHHSGNVTLVGEGNKTETKAKK